MKTLSHKQHIIMWSSVIFVSLLQTSAAAAINTCQHPFERSICFTTYSIVALTYIVIAAPYAMAALFFLKPRFKKTGPWIGAVVLTPVITYGAVLAGIFTAHTLDILDFPYDISPFFYMNWFVLAFALVIMTFYVMATLKLLGSKPNSDDDMPA